jgi:hypothetical protein
MMDWETPQKDPECLAGSSKLAEKSRYFSRRMPAAPHVLVQPNLLSTKCITSRKVANVT